MENRRITHSLKGMGVLSLLFQMIFLAAALCFRSAYLIGCGGLLLWLGGFRLLVQKHTGPWCSVLLILPAIVLCGLSAAPLFVELMPSYDIFQTGMVCVLVGAQACLTAVSLIVRRKEKDISAWITRQFDAALLCVLLPALVSQLLLLDEEGEWAQMVCLTGCVMGGLILLLGFNLLLCALCGYRGTWESIRLVQDESGWCRTSSGAGGGFFTLYRSEKTVSWCWSRLVMSIASASFFMFANALFSCGIGLARYVALKMQGKETSEQLRLYRWVSAILSFSGLCYAGYSVRLFFGGSAGQYSEVMALAIAAYTFVEFGIQIHELIKLRRQNTDRHYVLLRAGRT